MIGIDERSGTGPRKPGDLRRSVPVLLFAFLLAVALPSCAPAPPVDSAPASAPAETSAPAVDSVLGPEAVPAEVVFPPGWRYPALDRFLVAPRSAVATTDSLASSAAVEILRAGGNAIDAAVAVQFALAVVNPAAGNIGGGGFLVARLEDGTTVSLDFREEAPAGATPDMYVTPEGEVTDASWTGPLASGVPGSVAGMAAAHRRFGTLPWTDLLEPAVRLARDGFLVDEALHRSISGAAERLRRFPASVEVFLPGGEPPAAGSRWRQPDLARTLETLRRDGPEAFYHGWIADSLAATMRRQGGLIDREDLARYEAVWRDPIVAEYRGHSLITMPPPSSGGVTLAEMLNIVESFDLRKLGWHTADAVHVMVEAMRRAYGDRNYYLGDPDFVEMPLERLTSQDYADSLAATIDLDRASSSERFNKVPLESPSTTHFSIVDSAGNAVAVTTTLNGGYGSAVTVRGAGFVLNNEMDDFTAKPGTPNAYGLVQGRANAIRPGKRMLSAMSPTILVDPKGRTRLVTGTPGGSTIITTVFQMVANEVDFGLPPRTSVNAPRFHHQNLPDRIRYEPNGLRREVVSELRRRGHEVREREGVSGDVHTILVTPEGRRIGVSDRRRGGAALGH